ncbi:MAG: hypothetical protein WA421_05155, partial [Nitrososphaeraceae archaeon]
GALYLNALDIDSKQVFDSLATIRFNDKDRYFIDEMCKITNVTQTRRHIYWLSHKQYQPIRTRDCKPACALEIKTDKSTGLCTLPDSIHRDDPNFHYQSMGSNIISVQDGLYDGLVKELTDSLRQIKKPQGVAYCKSSDYSHNTNIIDDSDMISLSETNIAEIIAQLNQFYQKGLRDDFVYGLSGYLYKNKVKLESAEKIIDLLCQSTHDEEHKNRITVLHNTYKKADTGAPIAGYSPLIDILTRASDEHNAHSVLKNTSRILNIYRNPILSQLDNTVAQELSKHSFEVVCYSPFNFVIAHSEKRQILSGTINTAKRTEDNEKSEPIQYVQYGNVIIDAVPNKITRYENPSSIEIKYEMEFETPTGQFLKIQPANLDEILGYLKINGLVYKVRAAEEALPAILNAYYREGKMTVKREIETPGFYLINNKIEAYKAEHKQPTEEEIRKCAALLISLQSKYKRKEIFPTFLKWGIMAPFSYILKQIDGEQWMPWLFPYGWTNTGKTT